MILTYCLWIIIIIFNDNEEVSHAYKYLAILPEMLACAISPILIVNFCIKKIRKTKYLAAAVILSIIYSLPAVAFSSVYFILLYSWGPTFTYG